MTEPVNSFTKSFESRCTLSEVGSAALNEAIKRDENYQRDVIDRDFLKVLTTGLVWSVIHNENSEIKPPQSRCDLSDVGSNITNGHVNGVNRGEFLRILAIGLETSYTFDSDSDAEDDYREIEELEEVHKWCPKGLCPEGRHETHYCVNATFNPQGIAYDDSNYSTDEYGARERVLTERICHASRLASNSVDDHGQVCKLPLRFCALPSGSFPWNNFTIPIVLSNLDENSLKILAMVCKWTNDIVNENTLIGVAIICARDWKMQLSNNRIEDIYAFMSHVTNICAEFSTKVFTKLSQDYMNKKEKHFEIIAAIDHGEATLVDTFTFNGEVPSEMFASLRKGFLIKIESKLFAICVEFQRSYGYIHDGVWECSTQEIFTALRIKEAIVKIDESSSDRDVAFANILRSQTCFSHQPHDSLALPKGKNEKLELSLGDLCLLSNKTEQEFLDCLNCNKDELNNFFDSGTDVWDSDYRFSWEKAIDDNMMQTFQDLIETLVKISFSDEVSKHFIDLLKREQLKEDDYCKLPLQTLKFKPRKWPLWQHSKLTHDDEDEEYPNNFNELFTIKDTDSDGFVVYEN